jgi:hypothetical protein
MDDRTFWLAIRRALKLLEADPGIRGRSAARQALSMVIAAIESRYNVDTESSKITA